MGLRWHCDGGPKGEGRVAVGSGDGNGMCGDGGTCRIFLVDAWDCMERFKAVLALTFVGWKIDGAHEAASELGGDDVDAREKIMFFKPFHAFFSRFFFY